MNRYPELAVRAVHPTDEPSWQRLFRGYLAFYRVDTDAEVLDRVWSWVTDPTHEVDALVAVDADELVGLAHIRRFSRPSTATIGLYLDDLYVDPEARGRGIGRELLGAVRQVAAKERLSVIRWITAVDNAPARALYDSEATATPWITYDMTPDPLSDEKIG